jgi:hypothetical protein
MSDENYVQIRWFDETAVGIPIRVVLINYYVQQKLHNLHSAVTLALRPEKIQRDCWTDELRGLGWNMTATSNLTS